MKRVIYLFICLIILSSILSFNNFAEATEWTNLYKDVLTPNYPSFESIWNSHPSSSNVTHVVVGMNNGSTNENFLDARFILNEVFVSNYLPWDMDTYSFTDGIETVEIERGIDSPDGFLDNSDGLMPNIRVGIWPYFEFGYGDISAGEHATCIFKTRGEYIYLEGDTIAHVTAVPEPATMFLFLSGLLSLIGVKFKKWAV